MKKPATVTTVVSIIAVMCLALFLSASPAAWSAPNLINISGKLTNNLEAPITNSALPMKFRIYDASTSGTMQWGESQTVNVEDGIYSVLLGSGTPLSGSGSLDATVFPNDSRYLEVEVNGQILSPRQRITSVGYALRTAVADEGKSGAITGSMIASRPASPTSILRCSIHNGS